MLLSTSKPGLLRLVLVLLLAVLAATAVMATPAVAASTDGEFINVADSNVVHPPKQVTINGKKYVNASYDSVPVDCPSTFSNCQVQFRLANKCTGSFCTWYEHTPTTITAPRSSGTVTARLACGTHYWKLQSRLIYTTQVSQRVREAYYQEFGYSSEGSIGGSWNIFKFIAQAGTTIKGTFRGSVTRDVTRLQTYATNWTDVDQAAGTIATSC